MRKGSTSEYGVKDDTDYYQPMTVRLTGKLHRCLEYLGRVVAPRDEVKKYMDEVMENTTRAEYVLLAMRLPRKEKEDGDAGDEKESNEVAAKDDGQERQPPERPAKEQPADTATPGVLWTTTKARSTTHFHGPAKMISEDEEYQSFIARVASRDTDSA